MEKKLTLIQDALARKKISDFEIFIEQSRDLTFEVKEGALDALEDGHTIGFGLRVLSDQKVGFSYGTDFSPAAITKAVERASEAAQHTTPHKNNGWPKGAKLYPKVANLDPTLSTIPIQEKIETARLLEKTALATDSSIKRVRYASYAESVKEIRLVNSHGLNLAHQKSYVTLSLMAVAEKGKDSEMAFDTDSSPFWKDLNPQSLARKVAQDAAEQLGGKRISNYRGPVVLNPNVASDMLSVLAPSTLAENIHKKNSFLIGKKGQKIYSDKVSLIDDGLYPTGEETAPFDDEGTPRQKTVVIEKGMVRQFLYDTFWGKEEKVPSTGNALREGLSQPKMDVTNFYLLPGAGDLKTLLAQMGEGILVTQVIGMHTADAISGDFSVGVQGFWVKNGKQDHPVRSVALTGNLHDLFAKVSFVAADLKFGDNIGSPSLLISEASVAGE